MPTGWIGGWKCETYKAGLRNGEESPVSSGCLAHGEPGVLSAVHWDLANQSVTLAEDERDRRAAMLEDDAGGGKGLYPLLGWHTADLSR